MSGGEPLSHCTLMGMGDQISPLLGPSPPHPRSGGLRSAEAHGLANEWRGTAFPLSPHGHGRSDIAPPWSPEIRLAFVGRSGSLKGDRRPWRPLFTPRRSGCYLLTSHVFRSLQHWQRTRRRAGPVFHFGQSRRQLPREVRIP